MIILAIGAVARVVYDMALSGSVFLGVYMTDSLVLHTWATEILAGETADLAFFRAPLYPYLVAALYKFFGVSAWSVIIFQNLLGLLTGIVAYFLARLLFGQTVAFWAALTVVVYPTLVFFEGETMITTTTVFLYSLAVYRLLLAVQEPIFKNVFLAGLVFGLAAITRPTILPLAIIFPVVYLVRYRLAALKAALINTLMFAVVMFIPILPVTMVNMVKGGEFILISTQGGVNFYIGNNKDADGISVRAPGPNLRVGHYQDNIWTSSMDEAEHRNGRAMSQSEVSSFWYREAFRDMRSDPWRAVKLLSRKFYLFWHGQEIFNNKPVYYAGEYSWLMRVLIWKQGLNFPSGILFPLMFAGALLAFVRKKEILVPFLFIMLFALVVSAFFVCARFRQPIVPLAIVVAAFGAAELRLLLTTNWKRFAACVALIGLLAVGLNWGGNVESAENLSQFNAAVGGAYLNKREHERAVEYFERALKYLPDNLGVYDLLGQSYVAIGRTEDAKRIYTRGIEQFPTYPVFNFNLGQIYQNQGQFEKAKECYRAVAEYAPEFAHVFDRLANIFDKENQADSALYYYRRLAELRPDDSRVRAKIRSLERAADSGR